MLGLRESDEGQLFLVAQVCAREGLDSGKAADGRNKYDASGDLLQSVCLSVI